MSAIMRSTKRSWVLLTAVAVLSSSAQLVAPLALAQPGPGETDLPPAPDQETLHNIVYRARVDGVSRGAQITYRTDGDQFHTANPTMVPGRVFEANAVLPASQIANVRISIEWPYSANLHCEILVDNAVVAKADDFVGPRLTPQREDPDFGSLTCQAPVGGIDNAVPLEPAPNADEVTSDNLLPPGEPAAPGATAAPPDPVTPDTPPLPGGTDLT